MHYFTARNAAMLRKAALLSILAHRSQSCGERSDAAKPTLIC